jgi:hypothetical protein
MEKAGALGLVYRDKVEIDATQVAPPINGSYREFGKGLCHFFSKPFYRSVGIAPDKGTSATTSRVIETIDSSVFDRWRTDASCPSGKPGGLGAGEADRSRKTHRRGHGR